MADPSHMSVSTMREDLDGWGVFYKLTWEHVLLVLAVLLSARLLSSLVRRVLRHAAEKAPPRLRLAILRLIPLTRLVLGVGAVVVAVPILVEPTFRNVVTLVASVGLALAFALKGLREQPRSWIGDRPRERLSAGRLDGGGRQLRRGQGHRRASRANRDGGRHRGHRSTFEALVHPRLQRHQWQQEPFVRGGVLPASRPCNDPKQGGAAGNGDPFCASALRRDEA